MIWKGSLTYIKVWLEGTDNEALLNMKVIISHDVDHLFWSDHLKDLIYPKLWIRETLSWLKRDITSREYSLRMHTTFQRVRHRITEVIEIDRKYGVDSTFFFGMANGLGMSYSIRKALPVIEFVQNEGFDIGVHGIAYDDRRKIRQEFSKFQGITGLENFGIRTHYVRYNEHTFDRFAETGYLFDTSEFDKNNGSLLKHPYKVGNMWEFPLTIMEGYLPYNFDEAKAKTIEIVHQAQMSELPYVTVLFHDYLFSSAYIERKKWYEWFLDFCVSNNLPFISYNQAIKELEYTDD